MTDIANIRIPIELRVEYAPGSSASVVSLRRGDQVLLRSTGAEAAAIEEFFTQVIQQHESAVVEAQNDTWKAQQAIVAALEAHQKCDGVHYAATLGVTDPLLTYIQSLNLPNEEETTNERPN